MMPNFSVRSKEKLATCDARLQRILNEAIKYRDFSVLCGHRNKEDQEEAYRTGNSTQRWPNSKHNSLPSKAVDIAPYPIDWSDSARFARLVGFIEYIAMSMSIRIRWGGDWNGNMRTKDEKLVDMPHIELVE
jgi:peptidoglycan LD-endopeptidase CwlK